MPDERRRVPVSELVDLDALRARHGKPPTPSAMSSDSDPVETASTSGMAPGSPSRMTEPLPNCFSICPRAAASAFLRFGSVVRS